MTTDAAREIQPGAERWSTRTRRFLFGDDVFVSYSRRDAADYALALASELTRRELSCFLDQWGTPPGSKLPEPLKAALRGSSMLVLVGTTGAAASENVREEVEEFLKTGRTIIPITFSKRGTGTAEDAKEALHGTLEQSAWYDLIRGTSVTVESLEALAAVTPSAPVIDRIANARGFTRRNRRLRQVFWGTLASIGVLLIAFATGSEILLRQAAAAKKAADEADGKRKDADIARGKAEEAEKDAGLKRKAAEILERRSMSERLSASSKASTEDHPQLALGLAVEAVNVYRNAGDPAVADAEESLRQALSGIGGDPLVGHDDSVSGIASSKDGLRLFTSGYDATVRVWGLGRGRPTPTTTLKGVGPFFFGLDLSDDERWLVAFGRDKTATLWDLARPDPSARPFVLRDEGEIGSTAFTPDGRHVLSIDSARTTGYLWDLRAEDPAARPSLLAGMTPAMLADLMKTPEAKADPIAALMARMVNLAWSDDGRWVVASHFQAGSTLLDTTKDDPAAAQVPLPGLAGQVGGIAATADGRRLALVDANAGGNEPGKTVSVWTLGPGGVPEGPPRTFEHPGRIEAMALSPDGRWLATGNADQLARLWDLSVANAEPKILKGHAGEIWAVTFSPDSRWLATGSDNANDLGQDSKGKYLVILWDLKPSKRPAWAGQAHGPADEPHPLFTTHGRVIGHVRQLAFSPDSHWLAARTIGIADETKWKEQLAYLWRMNDEPVDPSGPFLTGPLFSLALHGHEGGLKSILFTRDGHRLVTAGSDKTARVWDLEAEAWATAPISLAADGYAPTVLARGRWLAAVGQTVRLWELGSRPATASGLIVSTYRGRPPAAAVDGRGRRLAVASASKDGKLRELRLFDLTEPRPADRPLSLEGHAGPVDRIAFDAAGDRMVTVGSDGTILAWDMTARPPTSAVLAGPGNAIATLAISRDGRWLATAAKDGKVARLHDLDAAQPADSASTLEGHGGEIDRLVFSPDGHWLASRSKDTRARLWRLGGPGKGLVGPPIVLDRPGHSVLGVEISPDGRWLVTCESETFSPFASFQKDPQMRLWDLAAADPSASPRAWSFSRPAVVHFAPDGRSMATCLTGPEVKAIESPADSPLREMKPDRAVALRDLTAEDPTASRPRILDLAIDSALAFSPDGRRLLSGNQLVDLSEGADPSPVTLPVLGTNTNPSLRSAGFSPDGRWAILGVDGRVELHPIGMDELLGLARDAAARNLTREEWKRHLPDQPQRKTFPDLP